MAFYSYFRALESSVTKEIRKELLYRMQFQYFGLGIIK